MGPMIWAGLVALGVAVASMAIFAARLTRRHATDPAPEEEFVPSADPSDPWAAYRPRPFDEVERRRPRMWPAVAGVFGLVLVAGGVVGARQSTQLTSVDTAPTTKPYIVDVKPPSTPDPTLAPTAQPTVAPAVQHAAVAAPAPTRKPATAVATGSAPTIGGGMSCSGGTMHVSVQINGTQLTWFGLYVDGKVAKGGPMHGGSFSTSYSKAGGHGDHTAEASAEDKAGHHSRKVFTAHCA